MLYSQDQVSYNFAFDSVLDADLLEDRSVRNSSIELNVLS